MTMKEKDLLAPLRSRGHRDRRAALNAVTHHADATKDRALRELEQRRGEINTSHAAALTSAEAAVEARANELDQELAREIVAALDPLMEKFPDAPRTTSAEIAKVWRQFSERAQEELGWPASPIHLGMAFAKAHNVLAETGVLEFWSGSMTHCPLTFAHRASEAILSDRMTPELEECLRRLETAVTKLASEPKQRVSVAENGAFCTDRAVSIRKWATQRGIDEALRPQAKRQEGGGNRRSTSHELAQASSDWSDDQERLREDARPRRGAW